MDMEAARANMIQRLKHEVRDAKVLEVMGRIPREMFVPPASRNAAYENVPLPIDLKQTISQPLIVAMMTEALELKGHERVLEIGTGSGYQAAILCELAKKVITVERHRKLAEEARELLNRLGYTNVEVRLAQKTLGWRPGAPYDAIIVTAGAPSVPTELIDQLDIGGRLVIPVGSPFEQDLLKVVKRKEGTVHTNLGPCRFVPLIGEGGWQGD